MEETQNSIPVETTQEQTPLDEGANSQPVEQTPENPEQEPEKSDEQTAENVEGQEQKPQETTEAIDWEKRAKDTQASFTKVSQELAELKKQVAQNQPRLVEQGKINPEFEQKYKFDVDNREFLAYDNLARQLEPETRAEVERLLGEARSLYNPNNTRAYESKMAAVKDYFRSDLVEQIATEKQRLYSQVQEKFQQAVAADKQERAEKVANAIKADPELAGLLVADSENFSPEVLNLVETIFDFTGDVDIQTTKNAIAKIKELGVKEYLAKQSAQAATEKAKVPEGSNVTQVKSELPDAKTIQNTPGLYTKLAKKYGQAKIDEILMKGK